jgi:hypothetical protein
VLMVHRRLLLLDTLATPAPRKPCMPAANANANAIAIAIAHQHNQSGAGTR